MDGRRLELGLAWQEVAEHGGISLRALANARAGDSEIRPLTRAGIEKGLQWEPGSVTDVLGGGDPAPVPARDAPGDFPPVSPAMRRRMGRALAEIDARITVAAAAHPGERLTGSMVYPDAPDFADVWDLLTAKKWRQGKVKNALAAIAGQLADDAEGRESSRAAGLARRAIRGSSQRKVLKVTAM
jgi:hypothetical protein